MILGESGRILFSIIIFALVVFDIQAKDLRVDQKCSDEFTALTHSGRERSQNLAKRAKLYVASDRETAYGRSQLADGSFAYYDLRPGQGSRRIRDNVILSRITHLGIPPGWTNVWISSSTRSHLQATGIDAKGRRQALYHQLWYREAARDKFDQVIEFGRQLGKMRRKVDRDYAKAASGSKEKLLAGIFLLLDETAIRIGNEESHDSGASFGITTLRKRHFDGNKSLSFVGKSGVPHDIEIEDKRVVSLLRSLVPLQGWRLFRYRDARGQLVEITAEDVRAYMQKLSKANFSPKNFRTWMATVTVASELAKLDPTESLAQRKRNLLKALDLAAKKLGNTRNMVATKYVPSELQDAYLEANGFHEFFNDRGRPPTRSGLGISVEELGTLRLLEKLLKG